jgi:Family of unknown function (DUF5706)
VAKNDQQESYEKLLSSALSRAIDFVKFAETKNAALLTFSSAWMLASVSLLYGPARLISDSWILAFTIALPLFIISGLISMLSFLPRLSLSEFHKDPERLKSLLYFGDAAEYTPEKFSNTIRERYFPSENQSATECFLNDVAIQICVNSSIAVRKFRLFRYGALATIFALAVLFIPAVSVIWRAATPFVTSLAKLWQ